MGVRGLMVAYLVLIIDPLVLASRPLLVALSSMVWGGLDASTGQVICYLLTLIPARCPQDHDKDSYQ